MEIPYSMQAENSKVHLDIYFCKMLTQIKKIILQSKNHFIWKKNVTQTYKIGTIIL